MIYDYYILRKCLHNAFITLFIVLNMKEKYIQYKFSSIFFQSKLLPCLVNYLYVSTYMPILLSRNDFPIDIY